MDYQDTLKYLYESLPMFQQIGGGAYKPGLATTLELDRHFGHPHRRFRTVHVAGTNGKGSCSHTLAAVLQSAGYRVGLFTSPHLVDFRERIRINGKMVPEEYVVRFVEEHRPFFEPLRPSFFELTTALAFRYFADNRIDVAVTEVGMGGRLDCTNIIRPDLCVITNIGFDHTQYLADTLEKIAREKAGIIKRGTPVVIGRADGAVRRVFETRAGELDAPVVFAREWGKECEVRPADCGELVAVRKRLEEVRKAGKDVEENLRAVDRLTERKRDVVILTGPGFGEGIYYELGGLYQQENALTVACALAGLKELGYRLAYKDLLAGFSDVCELTGLMGRWQRLQDSPELVCDTGHNVDGLGWVCRQLDRIHAGMHKEIHMVFGMVSDKDVDGVLDLLPPYAVYYFTRAAVKRALPEDELKERAERHGLRGNAYPTVAEAVEAAKSCCLPNDLIFVGGSSFIVADLLTYRNTLDLH